MSTHKSRFPPLPPPHTAISGLGSQVNSQKHSFPEYSFGKGVRENEKKIYYSKDHVKEKLCTSSPGPVYTVTPSAGLSHAYSYDRSVGRTQETKVTFYPHSRLHETTSGFGKQLFSHRQSQPTCSFGTGTRVAQEKIFLSAKHQKHIFGHITPGPGTSGPVSSLGSQQLSVKKSSPASRFGTSTRFMQLKCQDTSQTPGPGAYH